MTPLDVLYRCQRAWERTQPQLFWTDEVLWPGLDEPHAGAVRFVEPVTRRLSPLEGGGLGSTTTPPAADPGRFSAAGGRR